MNLPEITISASEVVVALLTFFVVVFGLITTRDHFRILRAMTYIERFNSELGIELRKTVDVWLASGSDEQRLKAFHEDPELRVKVLAFMNIFQELGVAYRRSLLNKEVVSELFDFLAPYYWSELQFLIKDYRDRSGNPYVYRKFGIVNEEMLKLRNKADKKRQKFSEKLP